MTSRRRGAAGAGWRHVARSLAAVMLLCVGCGYFHAGTWADDPQNWARAFGTTQPQGVVVVHSEYWRSPHWSREFEYHFEIVPTTELSAQLFAMNKLREVTGADAEMSRTDHFKAAPAWWAPGDASAYEVWVYEDQPSSHFRVLIDKRSGNLFIADWQA